MMSKSDFLSDFSILMLIDVLAMSILFVLLLGFVYFFSLIFEVRLRFVDGSSKN
jgi:hypothetical protein